jgi:hypothetical protein
MIADVFLARAADPDADVRTTRWLARLMVERGIAVPSSLDTLRQARLNSAAQMAPITSPAKTMEVTPAQARGLKEAAAKAAEAAWAGMRTGLATKSFMTVKSHSLADI